MGIVAIGALHILPIWLYAYQGGFLTESLNIPPWGQVGVMTGLVMGRGLCLAVEVRKSRYHGVFVVMLIFIKFWRKI